MAAPSGKNQKRGVFDVQGNKPRSFLGKFWSWIYGGRVVNLRPKLHVRHPWLTLGGVLLAVFAATLGARQFFTRAEVTDFSPAVCLGDWENAHLAQGEPDTFSNPEQGIGATNSAVFRQNLSQIFCGGFVPTDFATEGQIKNVGITFIWDVEGGKPDGLMPSGTDSAESVGTAEEAESSAATTTETSSPSSGENQTPEETIPPSAPTSSPPVIPEVPGEGGGANLEGNIEQNSSFSFFGNLFRFAFAQTGDAEAEPASTPGEPESEPLQVLSPELPAPSSVVPLPEVLGESPAISTSTEEATTTEISPPIVVPLAPLLDEGQPDLQGTFTPSSTVAVEPSPQVAGPDERFLRVSYNADGQNWIDIIDVKPSNLKNLTLGLPIRSWQELKDLQIKVSAIPTSLNPAPTVYLDGILLEVHYELPPALDVGISFETAPPAAEPLRPVIQTYDQEAWHACKVEPFSQTAEKGDGAQYSILLKPSDGGAVYELLTGDLPPGVSAYITPTAGRGASSSSAYFRVAEEAQQGSFNIVVIYREENKDGKLVPNFCQLNLIVK